MLSWIFLILAAIGSAASGSCLKLSEGFTRIVPSILSYVFFALDILSLSVAVQRLDMGIVYAVWTGLSATLLTIVGFFFFKEPFYLSKILSIGLVIVGSIILKLA